MYDRHQQTERLHRAGGCNAGVRCEPWQVNLAEWRRQVALASEVGQCRGKTPLESARTDWRRWFARVIVAASTIYPKTHVIAHRNKSISTLDRRGRRFLDLHRR